MISYSAYMRHFYINTINLMASVLFHEDTQSIFTLLAYEWTKVTCTVSYIASESRVCVFPDVTFMGIYGVFIVPIQCSSEVN